MKKPFYTKNHFRPVIIFRLGDGGGFSAKDSKVSLIPHLNVILLNYSPHSY